MKKQIIFNPWNWPLPLGGIILVIIIGIAWFAFDRQSSGGYQACSSEGCINGTKFEVSYPESCIKNEKNEVICGSFILKVK